MFKTLLLCMALLSVTSLVQAIPTRSRASSLSSDSSLPSTPPSRSQSPAAQTRATTNSWSSISVKLMQLSEGGRGWDEEKIVKKTLYQCSRKWGNGKTCTYLVEDKREHTDSDHDKDHKSDTAFTASLYTDLDKISPEEGFVPIGVTGDGLPKSKFWKCQTCQVVLLWSVSEGKPKEMDLHFNKHKFK